MERACWSLCDLQVGAASTENEDCVLQGCGPARRLSEPDIRLPRIHVPSEESAGERRSSVCLLPAFDQPESDPASVNPPIWFLTLRENTFVHQSSREGPFDTQAIEFVSLGDLRRTYCDSIASRLIRT